GGRGVPAGPRPGRERALLPDSAGGQPRALRPLRRRGGPPRLGDVRGAAGRLPVLQHGPGRGPRPPRLREGVSPGVTMPDADALVRPLPLGPLPETPLVSVLVANYNYAGYVAAAVESALAQTYRHLEVVVCDDGSTDDSLAVLHALAERDGRVRVVAQENGGQASALNGAYAAARGDILCVLDADDVYEPEKVAATVEGFRAHPEAGFLIHNVVVIDGEGRVRGRKQEHEAMPAGWLAPRVLALGGPLTGLPPASGLSLRRPVAAHLFPLDPAYRSLADGLVKAGAPVLTPVVALPQVLARFRIHGANLTSAASGSVAARRKVLGVIRRHHAYI